MHLNHSTDMLSSQVVVVVVPSVLGNFFEMPCWTQEEIHYLD